MGLCLASPSQRGRPQALKGSPESSLAPALWTKVGCNLIIPQTPESSGEEPNVFSVVLSGLKTWGNSQSRLRRYGSDLTPTEIEAWVEFKYPCNTCAGTVKAICDNVPVSGSRVDSRKQDQILSLCLSHRPRDCGENLNGLRLSVTWRDGGP